jgi:hypothetical protein
MNSSSGVTPASRRTVSPLLGRKGNRKSIAWKSVTLGKLNVFLWEKFAPHHPISCSTNSAFLPCGYRSLSFPIQISGIFSAITLNSLSFIA